MTGSAAPQSFADVIALLEPLTDEAFVPRAVATTLELARRMPPVACGGFEFSLTNEAAPVDLMQCHVLDTAGIGRLIEMIAARPDAESQPWPWLHALITGDRVGIASIWLEYDADAPADVPPSIFLEFDSLSPPSPERVHALLDAMPLADRAAKSTVVRALTMALPDAAHVSHLGAMFSRADTPLRLNIKRMRSSELTPFLAQIGLDARPEAATRIIADAYRATVCLDVTDRLLPRLGIEYLFSTWPAREEGWRDLADAVCPGAVSTQQWTALQNWARTLSPLETALDWPDPCIIDAITYPEPVSSVIECGPSHIKATFVPGRPPTLKAYVGFRPSLVTRGGEVRAGDMLHKPARLAATTLGEVIDRALAFLLRERTQDGLWRDFDFGNLASDEWVSGYVGAHLLALEDAAAHDAAASAWAILRNRRAPEPGWGYHRKAPPDADSTAWVVILAQRLGLDDDPRVRANRDFLARHLDANGAAVTYSAPLLAEIGRPLPDSAAHDQWHGRHGEVTASAALAGLDAAVANLRATQAADGSWPAFWIGSDAYSTGLACEALRSQAPSAAIALHAAARWACAELTHTGQGAFDRAWLLRTALDDAEAEKSGVLTDAIDRLARSQRPDGSWTGSCAMIVPVPGADPAAPRIVNAYDIHGSFTTATVLAALYHARARGFAWSAG
ncbi:MULTISPECIES: prenyltransferase/squalene oxidase repeat-containing protein [unclassified Sphingomonas]|uniref:prenyltransferase/squalene oxidase repeat-containing protein n=1 Tax=unclassified Sphingomonas TaxID=196159 RepID=UPI0008296841|nr:MULTISPECIES: prenyltransferase/squalene oxidase repeat-containing protein [unclassified Sphingomonas]